MHSRSLFHLVIMSDFFHFFFRFQLNRHSDNLELAARVIKENMDKKFGPPWHSVVGEYFSFEISHEVLIMNVHHQLFFLAF